MAGPKNMPPCEKPERCRFRLGPIISTGMSYDSAVIFDRNGNTVTRPYTPPKAITSWSCDECGAAWRESA